MITTETQVEVSSITNEQTRQMIEDALSVVTTAAKAYKIEVVNGQGMARQGDVLLRRVGNMPPGLKDQKPETPVNGLLILVRGEAGGNTHGVAGPAEYRTISGQPNVIGYLKVEDGKECVLRHEEHGPQIIPSGTWEIRRQTQGAEWRDRVAD